MLFVDNNGVTDPRLNLALEEYLLRGVQTAAPLLLLYVNEPSVIVGRNQNVFEEVHPMYLKRNNLHLLRRLSGGGTVYHDLGNLNFSFIVDGQAELHKFAQVLEPVIQSLRELGVDAAFRQRSDIVVGNHKISGNAQFASKGRMFSHGTLLFDTDLDQLERAISPRSAQIESRAVQSVRSSVRNIHDLLPASWAIADLKDALIRGITGRDDPPRLPLIASDWDQIRQIAVDRYASWEWNIARSPRFALSRSGRFSKGELRIRLEVEKGRITSLLIAGDALDEDFAARLASTLSGARYSVEALLGQLDDFKEDLRANCVSAGALASLLY